MNKFTNDYIWGSGFTTFPWYEDASYDEDTDTLRVTIEDDGERTHVQLSSADLWAAFQKLLRDESVYFSAPATFKRYETIDLDAADTDCIVQQAVLGEVMFG